MRRFLSRRYSLISTSTPDGRSSFISASTVCGVGSRMSSNRLCVRISNCSRDFLSTCGDRRTVQRLIAVGSRTGPATRAPVRRTVSTISLTDRSSSRWSYARSRIRIFWSTSIAMAVDSLLLDLGHDARAHRPTPLPDREPQLLLHRDRRDQRHIHRHVVPRPHPLHPPPPRAPLAPPLHAPPPHPPRHHRPPPRDRKNVLDRHQKRLVHRPDRRRNVTVHRLHQLPNALRRLRVRRLLHRPQRRPPHHRHLVPGEIVLLQELPHLQLHQVQDLRVVHHVHLVH